MSAINQNIIRALSELLRGNEDTIELVSGDLGRLVSSVEYNSRAVREGSLFVAIKGFTSDGHSYIDNALDNGAVAILLSAERLPDFPDLNSRDITVLTSGNTRDTLSALSSQFYGNPSSKVPVIGITGTNGKTTTTYMLESILREHGYSPGIIGTINYRWDNTEIVASNTTPESRDIHELMARMVADSVDAIIMEVSSHGLELGRANHIEFDTAVFTNLTRDHLDFHNNFDEYFKAKLLLFDILERSGKENKCGIVNCDDEYGRDIYNRKSDYSYPICGFALESDAEYMPHPESIRSMIEGISYSLMKPREGLPVDLKISGRFNVYNSLCSLAVADRLGISLETIARGLSAIPAVPGRFERIISKLGFYVVVDYAHTDDALLKLLQSVRELKPRKLITLVGCGGNRDRSKRPIMGRVAVENSDWVIVTSDNPRNEKPEDIINDILTGVDGSSYEVIINREDAIKKAVSMADRDDIVVIAGKGHEDYQILGEKKIHFDDREIVKQYIAERELA